MGQHGIRYNLRAYEHEQKKYWHLLCYNSLLFYIFARKNLIGSANFWRGAQNASLDHMMCSFVTMVPFYKEVVSCITFVPEGLLFLWIFMFFSILYQ